MFWNYENEFTIEIKFINLRNNLSTNYVQFFSSYDIDMNIKCKCKYV